LESGGNLSRKRRPPSFLGGPVLLLSAPYWLTYALDLAAFKNGVNEIVHAAAIAV